ncbi:MAG: antibiotic acetyltransferase [Gammaproteobacteria bacterium]|nr:MAG: antibiotic acetyltransferase [Gammaproteobacteria bacterium]
MKNLLKNPITIWIYKLITSLFLEWKNKEKNLKIGYMSHISKCKFGIYNTIYNNVNLNDVNLNDFTYVASKTNINKTKIGKFCSIGPNCNIGLGKHPSEIFVSTHPIFFSQLKQAQITFSDKNYFKEFKTIIIGNDVWIGTNVIIVDGVTINDGAIVAAGSVVTKDIPAYAVVGGIPAKIIKYRFEKDEIAYLHDFKWWNKDSNWLKSDFKLFHNIKDFIKETSKCKN